MLFTMLAGLVHMFSKPGRGLTFTGTNVIQSPDTLYSATFLLTGCRAWDIVSEALRPRCVSLMDATRDHWYVTHYAYYLHVFLEHDILPQHLPLFRLGCSYIVHRDSFYPGCYAFESSNFHGHYIRMRDDGYLWIEPEAYTRAYIDSASYNVYEYSHSREDTCFFLGGGIECEREETTGSTKRNTELETVSIAEPLHNRQHKQNP